RNVTVDLYEDGIKIAFVRASGASVNIAAPGPVSVGLHEFRFVQIDDANNTSDPSAPLDVLVIPPTPAPPVLDPSSESGVQGDDISSGTSKLIFDVPGVIPGATVQLFRDGQFVGTAPANPNSGGLTQVTDAGPVAAGPRTYTIAQFIDG